MQYFSSTVLSFSIGAKVIVISSTENMLKIYNVVIFNISLIVDYTNGSMHLIPAYHMN